MKISIVIPAFNEELLLGKCLSAVLIEMQNSECDGEIIVVDNASTDRTRQVALSFPGVKVISEPQKGLSRARQAGFLASSGELVANVDADSVMPAGWLKTVKQKFQNPQVVALSGPLVYYNLPLRLNILVRMYYYLVDQVYFINRFVLHYGSILQGGNFVVRRKALEQAGGHNVAFDFYGEDTEIARRLSRHGKVVFSLRLPMYSSGRRLQYEGLLSMGFKYPINYVWTYLFKKPFHNNFLDVRPPEPDFTQKTTVKSLHQAMLGIGAFIMCLIMFFTGSVVYILVQMSRQSVTTVAQTKLSSSLMVRKLGPQFIKARERLHNFTFDPDEE